MTNAPETSTLGWKGRRRIYLDYHATTPCDPRVVEAMMPFFSTRFGNAASRSHDFGWEAEEAVEAARAQVAEAIGARSKEIVFTSGATEADNLALKGVIERSAHGRKHLVTVTTEHKAVLDTAAHLEMQGCEVTRLPVDEEGLLDLPGVEDAIQENTALVSVMAANNEIGVIQPIREIGMIVAKAAVLLHTDAAQALGKLPIDVREWGVHLLSLSAHKAYGPKGIGALYVRGRNPRVRLAMQMHGGKHESGRRSGTLPVPLIVGFGEACLIAMEDLAKGEAERLGVLRDRLLVGLLEIPECTVNGSLDRRLANNLNVSFRDTPGDSLLVGMNDVAVSSGSACTSASAEPSHVLRALGITSELSQASIRFGLGRYTTVEEIDYVVKRVKEVVERLRAVGARGARRRRRSPSGEGQNH